MSKPKQSVQTNQHQRSETSLKNEFFDVLKRKLSSVTKVVDTGIEAIQIEKQEKEISRQTHKDEIKEDIQFCLNTQVALDKILDNIDANTEEDFSKEASKKLFRAERQISRSTNQQQAAIDMF